MREILRPQPAARYVEVGVGVGTDALAMEARVIGVDRSLTMCRECRARGLATCLVASAEDLPLCGGSVDGCWADRTFQHLERPERALAELVRVARPGAAVVVVDPDYGTQAMALPDQVLARRVFDFRADRALRNGRLAHRMEALFAEAGLEDVLQEARPLVVRDPTSVDNVLGLRSWARTASAAGLLTAPEVERWEALYDESVARGTFEWSVTFFITSGRKAGRGAA